MRFLVRLLAICAILVLGTLALGSVAERWLIYPFDPTRTPPSEAGLAGVTENEIALGDETLIVWSTPPNPGQPVIFYLHGNAGNLANRAGRFRRFQERGYGLVALAYPGSTGSTGTPTQDNLNEAAQHIWRIRSELLPSAYRASNPSTTLLYGESLGTTVAIHLNADETSQNSTTLPDAIILEAPFTSIAGLAEYHYPGTGDLAKNMQNQWDSLALADQLFQPLLIVHGTKDDLIPIEMGQQVFSAAPSRKKVFITVKGAGHTGLWRSDTLPRLWTFIDQFALR
ncbi:alpha/beta hydrolase [Shimia sp.]|uniref:alpha/beta hydrolase n=1 Tax=Shimia sp. TaxID=1954381 RepID=UPI0032993F84